MPPPVVDPPRVRPAGSLNLLREDEAQLRNFRSFDYPGEWYEREAQRVLHRATGALAAGELRARDRILVFERDDQLQAVSVFIEESDPTAHLAFLGLSKDLHGARIDSKDGDRLSDAALAATLDEARDLGFERVSAQVARSHGRSRSLIARAGFAKVSTFDRDYDLFALSLIER